MTKGYVQVYTGNGKGKTTAAFGVAVRMLGAGYRVFIGQFLKKGLYSELKGFKRWGDSVSIEQFGSGRFVGKDATVKDRKLAEEGLERCWKAIRSGKYDLVILDELNAALSLGIIKFDTVRRLLHEKPDNVELILTGRGAPPELINEADLVTEMVEIKHYYGSNVSARTGIEK